MKSRKKEPTALIFRVNFHWTPPPPQKKKKQKKTAHTIKQHPPPEKKHTKKQQQTNNNKQRIFQWWTWDIFFKVMIYKSYKYALTKNWLNQNSDPALNKKKQKVCKKQEVKQSEPKSKPLRPRRGKN